MYTQWQVAMNDDVVLLKQLDDLKEQHRSLDEKIKGDLDDFTRARLKREKLKLRDAISELEIEIYPDMPA